MRRLSLLMILLLSLSLTHCDYSAQKNEVPFYVSKVLDTLSGEKQPVKVELDILHKKIYWLNKLGEIYRVQADGTHVELINKGFGADLGITYIEDFYLDTEHNRIYFTDFLDLKTGNSAIKSSTLEGEQIKTEKTLTFDSQNMASR